MSLDVEQLGLDRTMDALRKLLAERFGMTNGNGDLPAGDPIFALGSGLSSLEGIEFLCEVEKLFGVHFSDLDWWVYEAPTLANVAQYVIELSRKQHPAPAQPPTAAR